MHWNRAQNIIQCHYNNIWKYMCIKKLSYRTETYLRSNVQIKKQVEKYIWAIYQKLVLFLQGRIFLCVPENDIERDILGWTLSTGKQTWFPVTTKYNFTSINHIHNCTRFKQFFAVVNWPIVWQWLWCTTQQTEDVCNEVKRSSDRRWTESTRWPMGHCYTITSKRQN